MTIYVTSKFTRAYNRLPQAIKEKISEKEKLFRENPFHLVLETHRLHGKWRRYWAFSVDYSYRIMFQFLNAAKSEAAFINIGRHEIYK